ncbi:MAG: single-stranded DNA-binding protein [Microcystaceae cyanobacterium]
MNNCVLAAKVVRNPQLRYTQDNQTPVAEMLVEFEGLGTNDPPATLKVVGWGNLATRFPEEYSEGDMLLIEGRLSMRVIERPEGYKEKKAELVASRIHPFNSSDMTPAASDNVVEMGSYKQNTEPTADYDTPEPVATSSEVEDTNLDDIPF